MEMIILFIYQFKLYLGSLMIEPDRTIAHNLNLKLLVN